jgi:Rnl2 family RNA ligase
MISWFPYDKIPYSIKTKDESKENASKMRAYEKMSWIVTEKIHGANFSVSYDGNIYQFAKRLAVLSEDDSFFQYQRISDELKGKVQELWSIYHTNSGAIQSFTLYGELFGGIYPHPGVEKVPGLFPVQNGIYYTNRLQFMVFDIRIFSRESVTTYLPYSTMHSLCHQVGLLVAEPLYQGLRAKAMEYSLRFESTIPNMLKLPKLTIFNLCEGIVIRPECDIGEDRIRVKIKNQEFSELVDIDPSSDSINIDVGWFINRINQNRIDSAVSKLGLDVAVDSVIDSVLDDLLVDVMSDDQHTMIANYLLMVFQTNYNVLQEFIRDKYLSTKKQATQK